MNQLRDRLINFLNSRPFFVAGIAIFICSLMVFAQPGYRYFKKLRSEAVLERSKELVEEESYVQAFHKARAAVMLNGGNIEAARELAKLALRFNHPQAAKFWESVIQNEKVEVSDWAYAVDASFRSGDYATAFDYLLRWDEAGVDDPSGYALRQAQAYALAGQLAKARELAVAAVEEFPQDLPIHNFYLQMSNMLASPQEREQIAQSLILNPDTSLRDLIWIASNSLMPKRQRLDAAIAGMEVGDIKLTEELHLLDIAAKLEWTETDARIANTRERIDLEDTEQLSAFTSTLCMLGRYEETLALIDDKTAESDRILMRNRLLAQVKAGGIEETLEMTSNFRAERLTTFAEETFLRALAFQESGDEGLYENNINQAIDSAEFEDLAFLEYQFRQLGEIRALLELYARVSEHPRYGMRARAFWLNLASQSGYEAEISKAVNGEPDWLNDLLDPRQLSNAVYYTLLYGDDKGVARYQAEKLASSFRQDPSYQFLAAFAYYQAGLKTEAQQFISGLLEFLPQLDRRSQYIAAVINDQAFQGASETLLPRERALL
ncbi:tetratricopeptide repeat protein [Pelagicoccus albus]|uniref:Tetratricopeptide repeat-containing protein n=1 Tax=Pelagicoccus albus TaxID=415222 RepID=A0A7X1E9Z7_9BACT|nr:hypothetical protein [Pelagicoccus albus]MBC2606277.1 hypothetical protein [Pelagicoccus albus]